MPIYNSKTPTVVQPSGQQFHSRERLELMLKNGPDFNDIVQDLISKNKLPYTLEINADGSGTLKDTLSAGELHLAKFITVEPSTINMKEQSIKMARSPYDVLIIGETGTGKEIIAKSMISDRKGSVKAVNCAGFPETLIEAELFGYVRGAFTGANSDRNGLMTEAGDGVMFMDEIGELPLVMQAKLLRAIQEKRIRKVGNTKDEDISCKFVFATNRDLKEMVRQGSFRRDLYARISMLELHIKPLKPERLCDVVPICKSLSGGEKFLEKHREELETGVLDLSLNVRSLQRYVVRYNVLGTIV